MCIRDRSTRGFEQGSTLGLEKPTFDRIGHRPRLFERRHWDNLLTTLATTVGRWPTTVRPVSTEVPSSPSRWASISRRNARSVQTMIGWIFWDPGAVSRFEELGLNGPFGYLASRAAPFAGAGPEAVTASFGSISPAAIALVFAHLPTPEAFL